MINTGTTVRVFIPGVAWVAGDTITPKMAKTYNGRVFTVTRQAKHRIRPSKEGFSSSALLLEKNEKNATRQRSRVFVQGYQKCAGKIVRLSE